jgi:SNF2 family DNA or RNA helicase
MAILHGSWLRQKSGECLFIWGETWRYAKREASGSSLPDDEFKFTIKDIPLYPYGMSAEELREYLQQSNITLAQSAKSQNVNPTTSKKRKAAAGELPLPVKTQVIALPTYISERKKEKTLSIIPLLSAVVEEEEKHTAYLQPWKVEGFKMNPQEAIKFLSGLPLSFANAQESFLGPDLRFWLQIARWSLDLVARSKFLPKIETQEDDSIIATWQPLLDSAVDGTRLEKFSHLMPLVCRTYQETVGNYIDIPPSPQELLLTFLDAAVDSQLREMMGSQALMEPRVMATLPTPIKNWLLSLTANNNTIKAEAMAMSRLQAALKAWTMPLQYQLDVKNQFRCSFELRSPSEGQKQWTLAYFLQASDNSEFLVDATTIWNNPVETLVYKNRTIDQPQETLLQGLGLASRLYPIIAPSLENPSPDSCSLTPLQAYEFIKSVAWKFEDSGLGVILPPSLASRTDLANRLGLKITAQTSNTKEIRLGLESLLNFQWDLAIGGQTITKGEFDKLVALNSPLVQINGEWVELRAQDIKTAQAFFASRKDQMSVSLEDALRISTGDTQTIEKLPVVSFEASGALQELIGALTDNQPIAPLPTPKNFKGELRPYQQKGAGWLAFLERWGLGACLADDMGLGKTIQFIAFLLHLKEQNALEKPTLLVCPTSVLSNWEREVKKFAPSLKVMQYHGDKRPKGKAFLAVINKYDLLVTSYSLVHRDLTNLQSITWQAVVLDEAQNIKNHDAKQSQAVRKIESKFRIALTGTPVENRLQELWSILEFLNPGYLGNKQFFQRRFAIPIEKYGDISSLGQLRSLVQPFILRRLKTDKDIIQDLPEKQEMTVFCGLTPNQAQLYQQVVEESLENIDEAEGLQRRGMILGLLIKLKQICNHPAQFLKEDTIDKHNSAKLQRLEEMLEELIDAGDRALIFTQFAEWGKLLKPYLEKKLGREILFLYGTTSKKQREEMIDRFQHDPQGPPILILSLKAGGVGLNLTRANHVFHFDRWWNPAVENQATDRAFRIGQTRNVQVHKFVSTGTLEEKIHDMIESKKQLAEQVVGTGEDWLTEMDTDQLRNLLILDRNSIIDEDEE